MAVVLILLFFLALYVAAVYNRLVRLRNLANEGWSGIEVQLKRRADLVPNLVDTVKAYARHEMQLLEEITRLRNESIRPHAVEEQAETEEALTKTLRKLMAVAEAYPDLRADNNFLKLQKQLSEIEDTLQKARRYYNGTVRELNTKIESFPANVVAGVFSYSKYPFFELSDASARHVPEINL
jgi:LemA protein